MTNGLDKRGFAQRLLAQDLPPVNTQEQYKETLFKKLKQYVWRGKIIGGAIYLTFFLASFAAFWQSRATENVVHSICWMAVSVHILLWFLIYFLRWIYRILAETLEASLEGNAQNKWQKDDRFVTVVAVLIFAISTYFLCRSFLVVDPLRAVSQAGGTFWATVCFLFYYPFATASLLAKLWLEYKKMQLHLDSNAEE